ncbi:MAG: hypothetical protein AAGI53_08585 [Planctomycetota bacterium]
MPNRVPHNSRLAFQRSADMLSVLERAWLGEAANEAVPETTDGQPPVTEAAPAAETPEAPKPEYPLSEPVPDVITKLSPPGVLARLDRASRRGKLPGFVGEHREGLCAVAAFGETFDRLMIVKAEPEPNGRTRLWWTLKLELKMPCILAMLLGVSVWPGEPLTDSLLKTYFGFYNEWVQGGLGTWMWYLPMSIGGAVWTWRWAQQKSRVTTHQSAHEMARKIAEAVGGETVKPRRPAT